MIKINYQELVTNHFPDGTLLIKVNPHVYMDLCELFSKDSDIRITWLYESDAELATLIFVTQHLRAHGYEYITLDMPYIPNARQDRVKSDEDVLSCALFEQVAVKFLENRDKKVSEDKDEVIEVNLYIG